MKRRAFTLIELMIVIGVLLVLIGIAVYAARSAGGSAAERSTRITFEALEGMVTELEVAGAGKKQPGHAWVNEYFVPPYILVLNSSPVPNLWDDGDIDTPGVLEPLRYPFYPAKPITESADDTRFQTGTADATVGADAALLNTQIIMSVLYSVPNNRSAVQQMPSDVLANLADDTANTLDYDESAVPILLDGWRNPILFVPTSGFDPVIAWNSGTVYREGTYVTDAADVWTPGNYFRAKQESFGKPTTDTAYWEPLAARPAPIRSPDRRAFFVSAGPDGNFATVDDNLYSFEN